MNLPGRLQTTTLGDLLGRLHRAGASGILELVEDRGVAAGRTHRIFFDAGLVDEVETGLSTPLFGEVLARHGVLARDAVAWLARRLVERPGQRAGEILVNERLITPDHVAFGLRRQLRLKLDALFRLSEAMVRFHVRRPVRGFGRFRPLSPVEFLHGRPRLRQRRSTPRHENAAAYAVLGLTPSASADDVRRAFRKLAADVHPDRHPNADVAERTRLLRRFADLSAAYHALVG